MDSVGRQHDEFFQWAKGQGLTINNVEPATIPGHGLGVVARRRIEAGEELVRVPASALLSTKSIPSRFAKLHKGITVHGLLASFIAFGGEDKGKYSWWQATWPTLQDFQQSMPILWPEFTQRLLDDLDGTNPTPDDKLEFGYLLPPAIGGEWKGIIGHNARSDAGILCRQQQKLRADWSIVSKVFPKQTLSEYIYYWLIVNTRSFYYDALEGETPQNHDDCMVMCPFVDYFNHKDHGCEVVFDESGYTVISDHAGEEIFTSYGAHGNDFLLVEYGFTLDENKWDSLPLDDFFHCGRIDDMTRSRLKGACYYGEYTVNHEGVCHRTQVAIRSQILDIDQWTKFVETGDSSDDEDELNADYYLCREILQLYYQEAEFALRRLESASEDRLTPTIKATLAKRWSQIRSLIQSAVQNGINSRTRACMYETFGVFPSHVA